ncbi:MAG: hypothetical protein IKK00_07190 [Oscillospiraceae bacterium]|nr:hypothetical protein [Oscillospiraceae bacterium]
MKKEELFHILGEVEEQKVVDAGMAMNKAQPDTGAPKRRVARPKKWMLLAAVLILLLALSAFIIIPAVRLSRSGHDIDVSYPNAELSGDTLEITVEFKTTAGEYFEVGRHIIVATDPDFTNVLPMTGCKPADGIYVYEYDAKGLDDVKTLYVIPPIVYVPTEITPVSVPLAEGKVAKFSDDDPDAKIAGKDWFTVESVDIGESGAATVVINALSGDVPRYLKIVNGESEYANLSSVNNFKNDTSDFKSGEYTFALPIDSEDEAAAFMESASLVVTDALIRVDADDLPISSSIKSISVVTDGTVPPPVNNEVTATPVPNASGVIEPSEPERDPNLTLPAREDVLAVDVHCVGVAASDMFFTGTNELEKEALLDLLYEADLSLFETFEEPEVQMIPAGALVYPLHTANETIEVTIRTVHSTGIQYLVITSEGKKNIQVGTNVFDHVALDELNQQIRGNMEDPLYSGRIEFVGSSNTQELNKALTAFGRGILDSALAKAEIAADESINYDVLFTVGELTYGINTETGHFYREEAGKKAYAQLNETYLMHLAIRLGLPGRPTPPPPQ